MDAGKDPFLPDLRAGLPQELLLLPEEAEPLIRIKAERSKYQAALLKWLRNNHPADALHSMHAAVKAVTGCVPGNRQRAFWWVASALLDCLAHGSLADEQRAMLLFSRIDLQMKSLVDSQPADTDDTLREMLYLIAHSQPVSSDVAAVKQAYGLGSQPPQPAASPACDSDALRTAMHAQLEAAKESWEQCVHDGSVLQEFTAQLAQLAAMAGRLEPAVLPALCRHLLDAASRASGYEQIRRLAPEMAMALLLAGDALEHYNEPDNDFSGRARILGQRVLAALADSEQDERKFTELVASQCRMESRSTSQLLLREVVSDAQLAQQLLLDLFGDKGVASAAQLQSLARKLAGISHQAQNCLRFLGQNQPAPLLQALEHAANYFAACGSLESGEFRPVMAALDTLLKCVQDMQQQQAPQTAQLEAALHGLEALHLPPATEPSGATELGAAGLQTQTDELLEVFLEEAREVLGNMRSNLNTLQREPENHELLVLIRRGFHTMKGSGRMVGLTDLAEAAWAVERAMNKWLQAGNRAATPSLLKLVQKAETTFQGWVDSLSAHSSTHLETGELVTSALQAESNFSAAARIQSDNLISAASLAVPEAPATQATTPVTKTAPGAEKLPARAPQPAASAGKPAPFAPKDAGSMGKHATQDDVDEQLLPIFLEEADDLCPQIGNSLRAWRAQPEDKLLGRSLQRSLHTLKGSARMAGAMRAGEMAHHMEDNVVQAMRQTCHDPAFWNELESQFDRICDMIGQLRDIQAAGKYPETGAAPQEAAPLFRVEAKAGAGHLAPSALLRVHPDRVDSLVSEAGEISVARSRIETELREFKNGLLELTDSVSHLRKQLREIEIQAEGQMQARTALARNSPEKFDPLELDRFTRFQELTRFMNESVHDVQTVQQALLKNLDEVTAALSGQAFLNRKLQQDLLAIRMVPFASIAERLYRVVRQTCNELGKKASLELQGTGVEVDRSMLEKMAAPFEHLLRNSIAHGLEGPEQRESAGKPPLGSIQLSLRQEGNEVVFDYSDDGAGLDFDGLRRNARLIGLLREGVEASDEQIMQMIFIPGLTTSTEVTEVSGRGIGMDIVRSEIAALGGRITMSSERGKGVRFLIHLPLTLAASHVLMVRAGQEVYAIPSAMAEQVLQAKPAELEDIYHRGEIEWQGKTYPVRYLPRLLGRGECAPESKMYNRILLLHSGDQRLALHTDELIGKQEVVVKKIGQQLSHVPGIAGATVLGNGRAVLIINPVQLAQRDLGLRRAVPAVEPAPAAPLVMVVDDSLTVRKITSRLLARAGYQVATAKDGVDALEQLGEITPAVLLLDIEMPRMDGFELTRRLRQDNKTKDLPIIIITSRTAEKHRNYAQELGVNGYLGKPYQEKELLQQVASFAAAPTHEKPLTSPDDMG